MDNEGALLVTKAREDFALSLMHVRANRRGIKLRFVGPFGGSRTCNYGDERRSKGKDATLFVQKVQSFFRYKT